MIKPMLAATLELDSLELMPIPSLLSPKLDGIRCIVSQGIAYSRKGLRIPNLFVQEWAKTVEHSLDGELMLKNGGNFNECQSAFMSIEGEPNFVYHVFDFIDISVRFSSFRQRMECLEQYLDFRRYDSAAAGRRKVYNGRDRMIKVPQIVVNTSLQVEEWWNELVEQQGYEGLILRSPNQPYKSGRSTLSEGGMLKLKSFADEEGVVTGYEPLKVNANAPEMDEFGYMKRSSSQDGLVSADLLGSLKVVFLDGATFHVGSGFDQEMRQKFWDDRTNLIGRKVCIQYQPPPGGRKPGEAPRFPIYKGFRDD